MSTAGNSFAFYFFLLGGIVCFIFGSSILISHLKPKYNDNKDNLNWVPWALIIWAFIFIGISFIVKSHYVDLPKNWVNSVSNLINIHEKNLTNLLCGCIRGKAVVIFDKSYPEVMFSTSLKERGIMAKKADEVRSVVYIFLNKKDIDTGHTVHIYGGRSRFIIYNLELTTYVFDLQLKEIIAGPELFYGAYSNYPDAISTENIIPKARDENEALKKPLKDINNWLAKVPISS